MLQYIQSVKGILTLDPMLSKYSNILFFILGMLCGWHKSCGSIRCLPCWLWLENKQTASLSRGKDPSPTSVLVYDPKQSDGAAAAVPELCWMQRTPLLPSFQSPLWPVVVAPDRVLSMGQIELNYVPELIEMGLYRHFNCVLMLNWTVWNRTVFVFYTELFEIERFICVKMDLALITYNGRFAIKPNQTKP